MHEYFDVEEYHKYLVVQAQAALFILGYHGYLGVQSLWQTAVALVAVAWISGEITHVAPMIAGLVGLLLGVLAVRSLRLHVDYIQYQQVFYYLIQPAVLYYVLPLYAEQTMYPVGVPLAFLLWAALNLIMWLFVHQSTFYRVTVAVPILAMFFFSWLLNKFVWVPLGIAAGITVVYLMLAAAHVRSEKKARRK